MPETTGTDHATIAKSPGPFVFVSHDTRDAELAEAFSKLLMNVSAGVLKSFRSSDRKGNQGIEYGIEWYPEIIRNIQSASDVVCLLTERSVNRPWILFEAGMAKGRLDTPILGLALGIDLRVASTGPFAQFQNCADDETSLTKLVFQLVGRIPGSEPDRDTIRFQVGKFKAGIEPILKSLATEAAPSQSAPASDDSENASIKLFEEIKIMFQDLPSRIERGDTSKGSRRRRRLHPAMLEEFLFTSKDPFLGVRIGLSFLRDAFPWLYDEGSALLTKFKAAKSPMSKKRILRDFDELFSLSFRNPYFERLIESEEDFRLIHDIPRMIMHALERQISEA